MLKPEINPRVEIDLTDPPSNLRVSVDEPTVWVDRNLATASWWDRYEIQTCTAEVRWTTISHTPFVAGMLEPDPGRFVPKTAYYAVWTLDAYLVESYRESRMLSASRADLRKTREHTTVTFRCYAYEMQALLSGERQFSRPGRLWSLTENLPALSDRDPLGLGYTVGESHRVWTGETDLVLGYDDEGWVWVRDVATGKARRHLTARNVQR